MSGTWHDISLRLNPGTIQWPGDPRFKRTQVAAIHQGAEANVSKIEMSAHSGTHIDAPRHYFDDGADIASLPLDAVVGSCHVYEIDHHVQAIDSVVLERLGIVEAERVLFKTLNSHRNLLHQPEFDLQSYAYLTPDAATYLASRHVRCVGIDSLSIGGPNDGDKTHRILLGEGVWVIEGLDLRKIPQAEYELMCLPLRIDGADGAPARAVLREFNNGGEFRIRESAVEDAIEYATQTG